MQPSAYTQRVHRVMDHVRQHFAEDSSLASLAKVAHFSPFHFHRIFKTATGETVTAFIQRVRLERACYLMMAAPIRPLVSIAHEVGLSGQSDFSRVFKQRFGLAPRRWDRTARLTEQGLDGYDAAVRDARAAGPEPVARVVVYPACLPADGAIGIHVFPALKAVDVHCDGPLSRVAVAWDYLHTEWLPRSKFEPDDMPGIKRFRQRPDESGWDVWDVDCSIAIRDLRP